MFLNSQCFFGELTDDLLSICQPFSCGNEDLDDFFSNEPNGISSDFGRLYKATIDDMIKYFMEQ